MNWHKRYLQQARWTQNTRDYLFKRARLETAKRVLDVGCGTGALLKDFPAPPSTTIHGLDLNLPTLKQAHAYAPNISAVNAAAEFLPYPEACFDLTFCHYLLLWVKNPAQVLREMARVTRPGGAVLALAEPDYNARIDSPASLQPLGQWQTESLQAQGADPQVGRKLAGAFAEAGIRLVENGVIGGGWRVPTPDETELEWEVLESDLAGKVPEKNIQKMKLLDMQAQQAGIRVLFVPTFYAWGWV